MLSLSHLMVWVIPLMHVLRVTNAEVEIDVFGASNFTACGRNIRLDKKTGFIIKNPNAKNPPGTWPWMVSMGEQQRLGQLDVWQHSCGGALVTTQHVVTAAHCANYFSNKIKRGAIYIRAGDDHLQNINDDDEVQMIKVVSFRIHPDYRWPARYSDIAILKLEKPVKLTAAVRTCCLPSTPTLRQEDDNVLLTVTGWGTDHKSEVGKNLYDTTVQIYSEAYCNLTHEGQRRSGSAVPSGFQNNIFCGGDASGTEGVCQGDSGSPAVFFKAIENRYVLKGIVSGGLSCGTHDFPNIYIRISDLSILSWIYHQIGSRLPSTEDYNLVLVEGVFEQKDKICSTGETCKTRNVCPYIQAKYEERENLGNSTTDKERGADIRDHLRSRICNKDHRAFCCPKNNLSTSAIPQLDQSCDVHETCERTKTCPFIKENIFKRRNATSTEQTEISNLLKSKVCNKQKKAYCCPLPGSSIHMITQIEQICPREETCETSKTCSYIQKVLSENHSATSSKKADIIKLLKSKVCNKQEKAYCCPKLISVSCILSNWSEFSPCSVSCRRGVRSRRREVIQEDTNGIAPCQDLVNLVEMETCQEYPCPGDTGYIDPDKFDPDNPPTCPADYCSLPPSLGHQGSEKLLEECDTLDTYKNLPIPLSENRKRGIHPVVCCPNKKPSTIPTFLLNCGCRLNPTFLPDKINLEPGVYSTCCPDSIEFEFEAKAEYDDYGIIEYDYDEYDGYEIIPDPDPGWCNLKRNIPKLSDEDCSAYTPFWGNSTNCVNIKDCPGIFRQPYNPSPYKNPNYAGLCGWDDQDKSIKICCPRDEIQDQAARPVIEAKFPGYQCMDRVNQCERWRNNDGCRIDMDLAVDQHYNFSSKDMFNFMMSSCMESCGRCGDKGCRDEHSDCHDWARQGFCVTNPNLMVHTCRESCGVCGFLSMDETAEQFIGENSYTDFLSPTFDCGRYKKIPGNKENSIPSPAVLGALSILMSSSHSLISSTGFSIGSPDTAPYSGIKFCGSTLISDRWVLTAAHCFDDLSSTFGENRQNKVITIRDDKQSKEVIKVLNEYKHPKYKYPSLYNDFALIELGRRVDFDWDKYGDSPMCLDISGQNDGKMATFQGYGISVNGTIGDLKEENVTVISNTKCKETLVYNATGKPSIKAKINHQMPNGLGENMFCCQGHEVEPGVISGPCSGDSGGPVFVEDDDGRKMLVGIISGGIGCGEGYPGYNTKVSSYISWIECIIDHRKLSRKYGNNWSKAYIEKQCSNVDDKTEEAQITDDDILDLDQEADDYIYEGDLE